MAGALVAPGAKSCDILLSVRTPVVTLNIASIDPVRDWGSVINQLIIKFGDRCGIV